MGMKWHVYHRGPSKWRSPTAWQKIQTKQKHVLLIIYLIYLAHVSNGNSANSLSEHYWNAKLELPISLTLRCVWKTNTWLTYLLSQSAVWIFQLSRNILKLVANWKSERARPLGLLSRNEASCFTCHTLCNLLTSMSSILRLDIKSHLGVPSLA